ncbi:MAG TPA: rhodanese-like domain-containing protein [Zeimonas sp.]
MLFRRLKTPGLAQHSYVLECGDGRALVVDPRRDIDEYLHLARENDLTITHVLETHRQEDFVHGSASLAAATGAAIVAGIHELFGRADLRLRDGEALEIGSTRVLAFETPGHTPESVSYAVYPRNAGGRCWGVFTGDALFVGETGRTDLTDPARTAENAGVLFDAIHEKLVPLGDPALLFPAHGSGSACGGAIADRDDSTLGIERQTNPVFTCGRNGFVEHKVAEKLPRPPYFRNMEAVNLDGGKPLPSLSSVAVLQAGEFRKRIGDACVIDTRAPDAFAGSHVPGAYNIWLDGLVSFGGWFAHRGEPVLLVTESPGDVATAALALARIGIDDVAGALAGGIEAWREDGQAIEFVATTSAAQAARWRDEGSAVVLDVRDEREREEARIPGSLHVYVGDLEHDLPAVGKDERLVVHCSVGHRSGIAASILRRNGYTNVHNLLGGMKAWQALGFALEQG